MQRPEALLFPLFMSASDDVAHQPIKHGDGIIHRRTLKRMRKGEEGCRSAFGHHAADRLSPCGRRISREGAQPIKRKMVQGDIADAERTNLIQSMPGRDSPRSTHPAGGSAKPIQERGVFTLRNLQQGVEVRLVICIGSLRQVMPQSGGGSIADAGHETLQRCHAWE